MKITLILSVLIGHSVLFAAPFGYQYISPTPGAAHVSPQTPIIIRFENVSPDKIRNLSTFIRAWETTGDISGSTIIASDNKTVIFQPTSPFKLGSRIHVSLAPQVQPGARNVPPFEFSFHTTSGELPAPEAVLSAAEHTSTTQLQKLSAVSQPRIMPNGVSVPSDFPHVQVPIHIKTADGYIFMNQWREQAPYDIIFDNDGSPVWYARRADGDRRWDFKVQKNGLITALTRVGGPYFISYDEDFNPVDEYRAGAGYNTDEHEFIMAEDGHYFLIGLRTIPIDMRQVVPGGRADARVHESTVQEFTADHQLVLNWAALEHLGDDIPYLRETDPASVAFAFPHTNAIDIDTDGNILLSNRNLSEIVKINRQTGGIIWRLGGARNQFTFVNDPLDGFSSQHDIRSLGDNRYSLFDNGSFHNPPRSRAVIYKLDTNAKTATLLWEFRNPQGTEHTEYMGNVQLLPNGNALINWANGDRPKATEVTPAGEVVYEMDYVDHYATYRTFRFPWRGASKAPSLYVEPGNHRVVLVFNKFGDPNVAYYNIYGGTSPHPTTVMDTSRTTMKTLTDLNSEQTYYFRVTAVSTNGKESPFSKEKTGFAIMTPPGDNLIVNGDFSNSKLRWHLLVLGEAAATWTPEEGLAHIKIAQNDANLDSLVFSQGQVYLRQGRKYRLEFDAWADGPRELEVMLCQANNPEVNYSQIGLLGLGLSARHYVFDFTMNHNTDFIAELRFHLGARDQDVYLDNVQVRQLLTAGTTTGEPAPQTPAGLVLLDNYPNPFNATTTIRYYLPEKSAVAVNVYNLLGEQIKQLVDAEQETGDHQVSFDAATIGSGIYFYELRARSLDSGQSARLVKKMIVVK